MAKLIGKFKTIGGFIDKSLENGEICNNQIIAYYDRKNNLKWLGKAEFSPIYLDWVALGHFEFVGNELRIWEAKNET